MGVENSANLSHLHSCERELATNRHQIGALFCLTTVMHERASKRAAQDCVSEGNATFLSPEEGIAAQSDEGSGSSSTCVGMRWTLPTHAAISSARSGNMSWSQRPISLGLGVPPSAFK